MWSDNFYYRILSKFVVLATFCLLVPIFHVTYASLVWDDSVDKFYRVLNLELQALVNISNDRVGIVIENILKQTYETVYRLGLSEVNDARDRSIIRSIIIQYWGLVQLCIISIQLIALRIGVILLSLPLLICGLILGVSYGVMFWFLRRSGGARDSAFIYHRLKSVTYYGSGIAILVYMLPPVVMNPRWIIPAAILYIAVMIGLTVGFFKKYL